MSATKFLMSQVSSAGRFCRGWTKSFFGLGCQFCPEPLPSMWIGPRSHCLLVLACIAGGLLSPGRQFAQNQDPGPAQLTVPQVVDQLVKRNAERANSLGSYRGRRLYRLDYVGFPTHLHAEMLVDMRYTAPASKEFTVVSQSGEKWIIDHVFKRLLETERAAVEGENWKQTALDNRNYNFTSGADDGANKLCPYALGVEPRVPTKFLYRGRIWVNAKDFAVCRIEAQPAGNPSIWIKRTDIRHTYLKVGDFWLPKENTSVSMIRLGGRATLTIEYQNYEILSAHPLPETNVGEVPHLAPGGH